jgi:epoxyqueuosine reductase
VKEQIRRKALELGFDDCRFTTAAPPPHRLEFEKWLAQGRHGTMGYLERNAFKRVEPAQVLQNARSVISLASSYHSGEAELAPPGPQIARYARYGDYHDVLADKLQALTATLTELGGTETKSLWYVDTGPLLERDLAQRAGLGFAGKHTNLISRKLGNWFFISEIITTVELSPDAPEVNRCGNCTRCITACPTAAITAPFELDARRCISYLTIELKGAIPEEFRTAIGTRIYGCDVCLEACPWNRFAQEGRLMQDHRRTDLDTPDLIALLDLDDAGFKAKFAGTPILRTKRRGLLRNVCVALGNVKSVEALPALQRAAHDQEPLIVEHAHWAIDQIKKGQADGSPISAIGVN